MKQNSNAEKARFLSGHIIKESLNNPSRAFMFCMACLLFIKNWKLLCRTLYFNQKCNVTGGYKKEKRYVFETWCH